MGELLSDYPWKRRYNQPPDHIVNEFYRPALARSVQYDRAVGFYSSRLLASIAPSLDAFVINGGQMRLITSPSRLSDEDLAAMGRGERLRDHIESAIVQAIHDPIPNRILVDRLALLTWMIAHELLEVKIALRDHGTYYSLFHEKIGVFTDGVGNWMTFTGSPNETRGGGEYNAESFPLHRSWASKDQWEFANEERGRFDEVFAGTVNGIAVWHNTSDWILEPLRKHFGERAPERPVKIPKPKRREPVPPIEQASPPVTLSGPTVPLVPRLPDGLELYPFQRDAVNEWLGRSGRGVYAMATGTGKTITALTAATQASKFAEQQNRPLLILVVVPLRDLVGQWQRAAADFGFRPAIVHSKTTAAQRRYLKTVLGNARLPSSRRSEMVITTVASLTPSISERADNHWLQRLLARHRGLLMVIGDEMHTLGTPPRLAALPDDPTFTLGLSATPKRHGDEQGTAALMDYFGDVAMSIDIREAIYVHRVLVPYFYHPIFVDLTPEEAEEFRTLSAQIAAAYASNDEDKVEVLVRKRSRLTQHAANKMVELDLLVRREGLASKNQQLVYAAEGTEPESDVRRMDAIERLLSGDHGMRVAKYFGETDTDNRDVLQQRLAEGDIQALIAMKCLDEGVDIPSARIGIITASTQNPRQFVQRRGRILRRDPDHPKANAEIYDMIVRPPKFDSAPSDSEKRLVGNELSRAVELVEAAENREVLFDVIDEALRFGLTPDDQPWLAFNLAAEPPETTLDRWA